MRRWGVVLALSWAVVGVALAAQPTKRPTDQERGKELYDRHCASCHGASAGGDGPATQALVVPVPDLRGKVKADKPSIDLVEIGKGAMPGFQASFDSDDAKRVLMYMGKLTDVPPEPPAPAPAEEPPEGDAPEGAGPG